MRPVGSDREVPVSFRLYCATNRNLQREVAAGRFRQDLYFRIAGIELTAPPLRDRKSDLGMLCEWLIIRVVNRRRMSGSECVVTGISPDALGLLEQHSWPGNVRELDNVLTRAVALAETPIIQPDDILLTEPSADEDNAQGVGEPTEPRTQAGGTRSFKEFKASLLEEHEPAYIRQVLAHTGGNITKAAEVSGVSRTYLRAMIKTYGLGV